MHGTLIYIPKWECIISTPVVGRASVKWPATCILKTVLVCMHACINTSTHVCVCMCVCVCVCVSVGLCVSVHGLNVHKEQGG